MKVCPVTFLTIMNTDYKIFAMIIITTVSLDLMIDIEQVYAMKGWVMWDNLSTEREILPKPDESTSFYITGFNVKAHHFLYAFIHTLL